MKKQLILLMCLLQAGTVAPMEENTDFKNLPQVTFDAKATEIFYSDIYTVPKDSWIDICIQEKGYKDKNNAFAAHNEIRINISSLLNSHLSYEKPVTIEQQLNSKNSSTRYLALTFSSQEDFESLKLRAAELRQLTEQVKKEREKEQQQREEKERVLTEKIKKLTEQTKERESQIKKRRFYQKLTLGFIGCGLGLGAFYLACKQPSWFMGGIKSLFGSLKFPSFAR